MAIQTSLNESTAVPKQETRYGRFRKWFIRNVLHLNYFRIHFIYFVIVGFIGSFVLAAAEASRGTAYIDALFMSFSAISVTGLSSVDISKWSIFGKVVLLMLMQLGSGVGMTLPVVVVRRYHMRKAYRGEEKENVKSPASRSTKEPVKKQLLVEEDLEYRSLGKLLFLIPGYLLIIEFWVFIIFGGYIANNDGASAIVHEEGVGAWWWAFFSAISGFNNCGLSLLSDNLIPFARDKLILLVMALVITLGNTMFPVMLRAIVWVGSKVSKDKDPYLNLLSNPRVFYTHLFPAKQTRVLLLTWIATTFLQMFCFLWLESDQVAFSSTGYGNLALDSFFQSVSTRSGGFNSVDLGKVSSALLVLYLAMMYLSAYPFIVSLRETAVNSRYVAGELADSRTRRTQAVVKDLLIRDIFWLYFCVLLISLFENYKLGKNLDFTVFKVLFEVVSAYGTVGLSVGYPGVPYSFSGIWNPGAKLVIIVVMLLGRHRGLPESIDSAVAIKELDMFKSLLDEEEGGKVPKEDVSAYSLDDSLPTDEDMGGAVFPAGELGHGINV